MMFEEWASFGIAQGWCGPPVCWTHDGTPLSESEVETLEQYDPCVHIIRLYEDQQTRDAVEADHSPSVWRKKSLGTPDERS